MIVDVPPAVAQIAQRVERQEQGIFLYRLHRVFDVHAGPMHRHDDLDLAVVVQDAAVVKVRVLRALTGGKPADGPAMQQIEQQYERPKSTDVFHRPFDPKYVNEYTFRPQDGGTYAFSSSLRDGSHGEGTFSLDRDGNVVKYVYTPYALPQYASSGTVVNERSQVLPGVWYLTREAHEYRGHYLIFGGGATAVITYNSFRRYADLNSALTALSSNSIANARTRKSFPLCVSSSARASRRRRSTSAFSSACSSAAPSGPEM